MEIANRTVMKTQRIYDTEVRGLTLKLTPSGHKTFEVYKKARGGKSPITVKICQYGDMSLEQIRSEAFGHIQTLRNGKNPNKLWREITRSDKTLQDALDWYAKTKNGTIKNDTLLQYRRAIANYTPTLLSKRLTGITTEEIISSYQRIVDGKCEWRREGGNIYKMKKPSPSQANLWARAMRAIINLAIDSWRDSDNEPIIKENPLKVLSRNNLLVDLKGKTTRIADGDIGRFFDSLDEFRSNSRRRSTELAIADALELTLFTGLRLNEVFGLTRSQVDLDRGVMHIEHTKNKESLHLPIGPYVKELLQKRFDSVSEHCPFLYPADSGDKPIREVRKTVRNLKKISAMRGLPELDLNFHDLRRSFVSIAVAERYCPYLIKRLINHIEKKNTRDITEVYVHFSTEDLERHVSNMEQAILRLAGRLHQTDAEGLDEQILSMAKQLSVHQKSLLIDLGKQLLLVK